MMPSYARRARGAATAVEEQRSEWAQTALKALPSENDVQMREPYKNAKLLGLR